MYETRRKYYLQNILLILMHAHKLDYKMYQIPRMDNHPKVVIEGHLVRVHGEAFTAYGTSLLRRLGFPQELRGRISSGSRIITFARLRQRNVFDNR